MVAPKSMSTSTSAGSGSSKPSSSKSATIAAPSSSAPTPAPAYSTQSSTTEEGPAPLSDPKTDISAYLLKLQSALQPLTRNAAAIPAHGDLAFHRSMDRKLAKKLDSESDRLLHSVSQLASWIASDSSAPKIPLAKAADASASTKKPNSKVELDLDLAHVTTSETFATNLGELVDHLLESADTCLDEYTGKLAPRSLANVGGVGADSAASTESGSANARLHAMTAVQNGKALPKTGNLPSWVLNAPIAPPQRNFTTKADNSAETLWSPTLKYGKPNAMVPLGHANPTRLGADGQPLPRGPRRGMYCAEGDPLDNPYYHEILHSEPPSHALSKPDPSTKDHPPPPLNEKDPSLSTDTCPFQWVSTKQQIEQLRDHLAEDRVKEIAVDLEHHSYRTYQGIVCLMQLSTRWGDWIIDTLSDEVRQHAELLNSSFTHPDKVKVLHGANHDVLWLQRDLGLYLVNLFDTYHATNVLMFPNHGLNYLMARYCNFDADKRYQLADWRIRPLPKEMLYYARSDTHTLLYIYDNLRHELMESGGVDAIRQVFLRSKDVAMSTYAKEEWDSEGETREGWRSVWRKWGGEAALGTEERKELSQMKKEERLVRALHKWRDGVARQEDESPRYILGANNLMMLAARAPVSPEGVLACVPPNATALKKRVGELAKLIEQEVKEWEKDWADSNTRIAPAEPSTPAAARSTIRGAVRSFASNLFGRSSTTATTATAANDGPIPRPTLMSKSSKLFGTLAFGPSQSAKAGPKIDAVKAGFVEEVSGLLGASSSVKDVDVGMGAANNVVVQPESVTFVPQGQRSTIEVGSSPSVAQSEDEEGDGSNEEDFIVVSSSAAKKSSKTKKPSSTPVEASAGEATPTKKELKKKRKAEALAASFSSPITDAAPAKKRKEKYQGEFDFASAPNAFETPSPAGSGANRDKSNGEMNEGRGVEKKSKASGKKGASAAVDGSAFRQPRDKARRKTGMGSTK